jgi:DNA-binding IclR family transcriptional regulator
LVALAGVSADAGGLGVVRLAELLEQDKSQVSRSLKALAAWGLVERDPETRAYRLGWRLYALAGRAGDPRLLAAARPVLGRLVGELDETMHLSVLRGTEVLTVLSQSPDRVIHAASPVGETAPASCTSAGRALLLDHGLEELAALFGSVPLPRPGPDAARDVAELAGRIAVARSRGFATVVDEFEVGLVGAAAPVRDFTGRVVAALNVSAPAFRFADRLEEAGTAIKAAAGRLSDAAAG